MDALEKLNQACREAGVCDPNIKHASELWKEGTNRRVRIACFEDGSVTSCTIEVDGEGKTAKEQCCYTAEDGGMELAMAWEAHLTSPEVGYKIKNIEVER